MLRATITGWLLKNPEVRAEYGDVVTSIAVPEASRGPDLLLVHVVATSKVTKDALRGLRRGDSVTVMGAARCSQQAGCQRGFEKWVMYVDAYTVMLTERFECSMHQDVGC